MAKAAFFKARIPIALCEALLSDGAEHLNGPGGGSLPGAIDAARIMSSSLDKAVLREDSRLRDLQRARPGEGSRDRQAETHCESTRIKLAELKQTATDSNKWCELYDKVLAHSKEAVKKWQLTSQQQQVIGQQQGEQGQRWEAGSIETAQQYEALQQLLAKIGVGEVGGHGSTAAEVLTAARTAQVERRAATAQRKRAREEQGVAAIAANKKAREETLDAVKQQGAVQHQILSLCTGITQQQSQQLAVLQRTAAAGERQADAQERVAQACEAVQGILQRAAQPS